MAATRSASEAFDAYAKCVAQQMKMTAQDTERLLKDFQYVTQKVAQALIGVPSAFRCLWATAWSGP
jgi:hypothetical protein